MAMGLELGAAACSHRSLVVCASRRGPARPLSENTFYLFPSSLQEQRHSGHAGVRAWLLCIRRHDSRSGTVDPAIALARFDVVAHCRRHISRLALVSNKRWGSRSAIDL